MKRKNISWKYSLVAVMIVGALIASVASVTVYQPDDIEPTSDYEGKSDASWRTLWEGPLSALGDPSDTDGSCIIEVFFINYSAGPDYTTHSQKNESDILEAWCDAHNLGYATADDFSVDIAHSTPFDIIVRVRGNQTHCMRGSDFHPSDLRVNITTGLNSTALYPMTLDVTKNDSSEEFVWCNFYMQEGTGWTIAKDNTTDINEIRFQAYY